VRPLAIDLYAGLGGWTDGLLAEGYFVIGFDIERHEYGEHRYPGQLVIQDVLTLHGSQFKDAALIVASPPCQEFSYMAMPWSRAKAKAAAIRADQTGAALADLTKLFDACFRIQREACEAAGRHIPLIVENVRGAQPWVGQARWNFGSFYLFGDVPALMPHTFRGVKSARPNKRGTMAWTTGHLEGYWDRSDGVKGVPHRTAGHWTNPAEHEGYKSSGMNWSDRTKTGQDFTRIAGKQALGDGLKQPGINLSEIGFNVANALQFAHMVKGVKIARTADDKRQHVGTSRKFASAMIARIPEPLSRYIARTFRP
jgi:C-5 cytosine-specific DNA methylase